MFLLKLSTLSAAIFLFVLSVLSLLCVYYIRMLCMPCLLFDRPEILSNQSFVSESRRSLARHEYLQGGQEPFFFLWIRYQTLISDIDTFLLASFVVFRLKI